MSKVADIIRAIDAEGSTSWQIADEVAALDEIDETTGRSITLAEVARRIYDERGVEWNPVVLGRYRVTAIAFPPEDGTSRSHPFTVAKELRAHPEKLRNWRPKKPGDVLTGERARALRGGTRSAAKAKPDAWKAKVDRALGTIGNLAENDPPWTVDALRQTIGNIEREHSKATKREPLRAV